MTIYTTLKRTNSIVNIRRERARGRNTNNEQMLHVVVGRTTKEKRIAKEGERKEEKIERRNRKRKEENV